VGAQFGLDYGGDLVDGWDEQLVTIRAVVADDELASEVFAIRQPVEATFMAIDNHGDVVDFIAVKALEATSLQIHFDQEEVDDVSINVGETVQMTVVPANGSGLKETLLAGALPYEWVSYDPGRVTIGRLGEEADEQRVKNQGDIEVLGIKEGTTVVRVRSGDLEKLIEVEVTP
jgi:hypothetical protein